MSNISKEILRNYVNEQKFRNPDEVLAAMKEMFKNVLQEALEAEMDTQLGYDKYDVTEKQTTNSRNGYSSTVTRICFLLLFFSPIRWICSNRFFCKGTFIRTPVYTKPFPINSLDFIISLKS